jgi:cysteinyl-tRNA synthetase
MPLHLYNSLTRTKELFTPLVEGHVGIYVCGPTVYSHSHVGHAKSYVSFDVIVRYLRYLGYKVLYVQNITDVGHLLDDGEDRMLKQSKIEQVHPMQIAETITQSYYEDMDALGIVRPDIAPRASGHITEQIELVKRLLERGYAYEVNGSVYFDVHKFKEYGKLSGRRLEDTVEGTRVEVRTEKKNPEDFALWKMAGPEHIMRWPSPWGEGFPGWHIECSAMSMKYLGEVFDTGKPFVRYWLHNNLVTVNGQKMSKSLGNFVLLKDLFAKYDPLVVRFFILQSHYRSTLDFSDEALQAAKSGFDKLRNTVRNLRSEIAKAETEQRTATHTIDLTEYKKRFLDAMDDDLNAPQAIAVLFDLSRDVNQLLASDTKISAQSLRSVEQMYRQLGETVLGIVSDREPPSASVDGSLHVSLIELLITIRNEVRKQKLWALSDMIRDGLKVIGIALEDKKDGTVWKKMS